MLDVHVLTMDCTQPQWVAQRRASIAAAVDVAGFPVHVHELEGEPGHIGRGRALGYALGSQPYVTYVDCDDYLLPSAFAALADAIAAGHDAVAPGETTEQGGVRRQSPRPHHLICYRRGIANAFDHAAWRVCGDLALANQTDIHHVVDHSYVHRLYESPGRLLRRQHQPELMRAHHG
ncbi:hypothetical protein NG831_06535 [Xanthomonas sacchari]|uniref:hypothetical protein n=1 Tax=Xanthomonas sacchari TaxID=56458 RepID=UPI00225BDA29|nr:hypothetical protein [Xanthomonas sacchari]MCW0413482.1 hypothetical protein [Xanthomonas sacchari]UYK67817.1 hypothetical protein NG831_06535 [Xanthomonas sacchari]